MFYSSTPRPNCKTMNEYKLIYNNEKKITKEYLLWQLWKIRSQFFKYSIFEYPISYKNSQLQMKKIIEHCKISWPVDVWISFFFDLHQFLYFSDKTQIFNELEQINFLKNQWSKFRGLGIFLILVPKNSSWKVSGKSRRAKSEVP